MENITASNIPNKAESSFSVTESKLEYILYLFSFLHSDRNKMESIEEINTYK
jgi:hypothetical protein